MIGFLNQFSQFWPGWRRKNRLAYRLKFCKEQTNVKLRSQRTPSCYSQSTVSNLYLIFLTAIILVFKKFNIVCSSFVATEIQFFCWRVIYAISELTLRFFSNLTLLKICIVIKGSFVYFKAVLCIHFYMVSIVYLLKRGSKED